MTRLASSTGLLPGLRCKFDKPIFGTRGALQVRRTQPSVSLNKSGASRDRTSAALSTGSGLANQPITTLAMLQLLLSSFALLTQSYLPDVPVKNPLRSPAHSRRGRIRTHNVHPLGHWFTASCRQPFGYPTKKLSAGIEPANQVYETCGFPTNLTKQIHLRGDQRYVVAYYLHRAYGARSRSGNSVDNTPSWLCPKHLSCIRRVLLLNELMASGMPWVRSKSLPIKSRLLSPFKLAIQVHHGGFEPPLNAF